MMDLRVENVCPRCGQRIVRPREAPWQHRDKTDCTWPAVPTCETCGAPCAGDAWCECSPSMCEDLARIIEEAA